jgi:RES domain-containing protein
MLIYHVTSATYKHNWQEALQGENATKPGRWSSPGTAMIYTSSHLTLAALEALVHCDKHSLTMPRITLRFEVDDALLESLPFNQLPEDWNALPEPDSTKQLGDAWVRACKHLGLVVPTATLFDGQKAQEKNILLNPKYPHFFEYLGEPEIETFCFDKRIEKLVND